VKKGGGEKGSLQGGSTPAAGLKGGRKSPSEKECAERGVRTISSGGEWRRFGWERGKVSVIPSGRRWEGGGKILRLRGGKICDVRVLGEAEVFVLQ